ncbi:hypothetical protein RHMOL_Rhmol11G0019600 [Rhododendron molle]|uniref:Uncharacterized protein n=1 Tax=Rhododendron molle TaxID=49168 RepID=A0ACC0LN02_RHOML|nr:hypothetical protein RHMOL_Rhmol11G0019600 [Rhododendron molle]
MRRPHYAVELAVLSVRFSIPSSVTLRKPSELERAYSYVENETCIYVGALEGGLRLPFPAVAREVLSFLGLAPGQIVPNSWRLLIGCAALWGAMSDGITPLTKGPFLNQFLIKEAPGGTGWYYFTKRPGGGELITDLLNVHKNWKDKFFFVGGDGWELPSWEIGSYTQRVHNRRGEPVASSRALFPLTLATEAELKLAWSYEIHSWDLLVSPESSATYLLGPETSREALALLREEEGENKEMAPKMDKNLLAQLKAERAKQSPGGVAPKRKSSRLQKELNVDSFLAADLSKDPTLDLVVEPSEEGGVEKLKKKGRGPAVDGAPSNKKMKVSVGPSTLGNF